jgi:hypothetical protein
MKARWDSWLCQTYQNKTSPYSDKENPYQNKTSPYKRC